MSSVESKLVSAIQKASTHIARGDGRKVVSAGKKLLKKYPNNFDVLHLIGVGYRLLGRLDSALSYYERALKVNPEGTVSLLCNLSFAYLEIEGGDVFRANECVERATVLEFKRQEVLEVSSDVSLRIGDTISAERKLQQALELFPHNSILWRKLARVSRKAELTDAALDQAKRAREVSPNSKEVLMELGDVYELRGETELALGAYEEAERLGADVETVNQKVFAMLATHGKKEDLIGRSLAILDQTPDNLPAHLQLIQAGVYPGGTAVGAEFLHKNFESQSIEFAIAAGFEKEGETQKSFEYYKVANANEQSKRFPDYSLKRTLDHHERLTSFFVRFEKDFLTPSDEQEEFPRPIFILGMPRSGTSLTEQLLGSHSEIHPAGELQFLLSLCKFGMNEFHGREPQQNKAYWDWVRDTYLQSLKRLCRGKRFVVDKMPHNYELVGFISRLFPNAVIIHSRRNPIDNCLSIYKANFVGYHPYAQDLGTLGGYYSQYQKLMSWWEERSSVEIFDSSYESLVLDTRAHVESVLTHCGLEWEDEISEFHNADRIVRTASNDQVRQPIYQSSVANWKKYHAHLPPLLDSLLASGVITPADLE